MQQRGEFVTAVAGQDRGLSELVEEQPCDLEQQPVAGGMTEDIVDLLEFIEVEVEQGAAAVPGLNLIDRLGQLLCEVVTVEKTGERIVLVEVLQPVLDRLALGDVGDQKLGAVFAVEDDRRNSEFRVEVTD